MASPPSAAAPAVAPTAEQLVRELVSEVADVVRIEMQLAAAERRPAYRELLGEIAFVAASGLALFFGAVALSWSLWFWVAKGTTVWAAALIVGGGYIAGAALLFRSAPARNLRRRLAEETREHATARAQAEQAAAIAAVGETADRMGRALARELAARLRSTAEHEAEVLAGELASYLHPVALLERLVGRSKRP